MNHQNSKNKKFLPTNRLRNKLKKMFELVHVEEEEEEEISDLKSTISQLNEIRAMQANLAQQAAEIVGNKKSIYMRNFIKKIY